MDTIQKRATGFSLLEVLAAVAIASFGLIALATLQMSLVKASAQARTQSIAITLAKEKIEQLRSFQTAAVYLAIDSEGAESITREGVEYFRTSTISRYVYDTSAGIFVASANTGSEMKAKDFKRVRVDVRWTDANGEAQQVTLEDLIDGLSPADSATLLKAAGSSTPRNVQVKITDPASDEMVIPMALSSDVESAATNPKPKVIRDKNTVETSFDVITYSGLGSADGSRIAQAKVETLIVGCTCDFGEKSGETAKRPTYWDGFRYTVPENASYTAPAGPAAAFANQQSPHCDICCRDHHDPAGAEGAAYSPLRVGRSAGKITAPHSHYANKTQLVPVTTGYYTEACRLVRVDGVWSVSADMYNDYFGLLATGDGENAQTPVPDSSSVGGEPPIGGGAVARYQNFVLSYMDGRFVAPDPAESAAKVTYNSVGDPYALADSAEFQLNEPASISIDLVNSVGKWLHARGLYVDYLEDEAVEAISDAKASSACQVSTSAMSTCVLRLLPFTTINLTELADWSPLKGPLTVTNNDYSESRSSDQPVRGKVTTSATVASQQNVITVARKSNSGLLDMSFDAISAADDDTWTDNQPFDVGGGDNADTTSGTFYVKLTLPSDFQGVPGVSYVTGGALSKPCGYADGAYTCEVTNATAIAGLGIPNSMAIIVEGFNKALIGSSSEAMSCAYGGGDISTTWPSQSSGSEPYTIYSCPDYKVATVTQTNGSSVTQVVSSGTAEKAKISFSNLNDEDTVQVNFSPNAIGFETMRPASCSYRCAKGIKKDACQAGQLTFEFAEPPTCP